jgi:hypothetical protein
LRTQTIWSNLCRRSHPSPLRSFPNHGLIQNIEGRPSAASASKRAMHLQAPTGYRLRLLLFTTDTPFIDHPAVELGRAVGRKK